MVPFKVDLSEKVAVVTGGGGVLCSEMARALGECGAKVAVLSRRRRCTPSEIMGLMVVRIAATKTHKRKLAGRKRFRQRAVSGSSHPSLSVLHPPAQKPAPLLPRTTTP